MNEILDRLHAENERCVAEVEQLLQPVFRDLLKLSDDWTTNGRILGIERCRDAC